MTALYRSDRQAEALGAYRQARTMLVEELGLEPGRDLRDLEQRILAQDPTLLDGARKPSVELPDDLRATYKSSEPAVSGAIRLPDGQIVRLTPGRNLIGRDAGAEIRLVDSRVSRSHAVIEVANGRAVLRDLGSTNGTSVGGRTAEEHQLEAGDLISVGGVELVYAEG